MGSGFIDDHALRFIQEQIMRDDNVSIIVYGTGIKALSILGSLEDYSIKRRNIVWVTPEVSISEFVDDQVVSFV
jgi:hypothetical protein